MTPNDPTQSTPPAAAPAPLTGREAFYAEHFGAPPALPVAVQADPVAPLQADPASQPASDVVATPPALTQDQILASLVDKVGQLAERINQPPAPIPVAAALPVDATQTEQADWLALMGQGKREEAEAALAQMVAKRNSTILQHERVSVLQQVNAERDMQEFTAEIRSKNADIAEMESYIAPRVQFRLNDAMQAGRIKSPVDYAQVYREALTQEVTDARNFYLRVRGAGAQAAQVRQTDVVAQPTLAPQPVSSPAPAAAAEPQIETAEAYLLRRQQRTAAGRGL